MLRMGLEGAPDLPQALTWGTVDTMALFTEGDTATRVGVV